LPPGKVVIDGATGQRYIDVGNGYVNPSTGRSVPKLPLMVNTNHSLGLLDAMARGTMPRGLTKQQRFHYS